MELTVEVFVILAVLIGMMMAGVPIAAALALVGFFGLLFITGSPRIATGAFELSLGKVRSFTLMAVPMFILMAELLIVSGVSGRLFNAANKVFSGVPGGLLLGSRFTTTLFSAVTGSSVASSAAVGSASIPEMMSRGYSSSITVGTVAAGGGLAIIMPPSILLIVYGFVAEVSVTRLFMAGIIPAILMALGYTVYNIVIALVRPDLVPAADGATAGERLRALAEVLPVLLVAGVVLGSIYAGIATVTEAAAIGVLVAMLLALAYRQLTVRTLYHSLLATARVTGFVFSIVIGALMFGFLLSYLQVPTLVTRFLMGLPLPRMATLVMILLLLMLLGTIMDTMATLLVVVPILIEPMTALDFNLVWIGIIFAIALEMGLTTPPFGINLFVVQGVGQNAGLDVRYNDAVFGAAPYLLVDGLTLALVVSVPAIALWLPDVLR